MQEKSLKNILWGIVVLVVILFVAIFAQHFVFQKQNHYATTTIIAPSGTISAQIADTDNKQTLGLGNRASLDQNSGMLFVFNSPGPQYIWMKDMEFPLDIVWIGADKSVTHIETNISPDTYSENPPGIFYSPTPALYVLELPAHNAEKLGITVGASLKF